jgi:hypothetical protein
MKNIYTKFDQEILHGDLIVVLKWYGQTDLNLFAATGRNKDEIYYCDEYKK